MKHVFFLLLIAPAVTLTSCKDQTKSSYYDLNNGEHVKLVKDEGTGMMLNADTRQPVYIYVNTETNDTVYGATGEVINGQVVKLQDGKFKYGSLKIKHDEDGDFKLKDGDYKRKIDADGDLKVKDGDKTRKADGDDGKKDK
jgi:hypothetical protein